jgi:hypothetical protein
VDREINNKKEQNMSKRHDELDGPVAVGDRGKFPLKDRLRMHLDLTKAAIIDFIAIRTATATA